MFLCSFSLHSLMTNEVDSLFMFISHLDILLFEISVIHFQKSIRCLRPERGKRGQALPTAQAPHLMRNTVSRGIPQVGLRSSSSWLCDLEV